MYNANALCQAAKLEGMSTKSETRLECRVRDLMDHNGPEFVVATLKRLKQHTIDQLVDPHAKYVNEQGEVQVSWNHKYNSPKGGLSYIYREFPRPEKRLRVIGALINSVVLETASDKQIQKFSRNIASDRKADKHAFRPKLSDQILRKMENSLRHSWSSKQMFSAVELSGSVVPEGVLNVPIAKYKRELSNRTRSHRGDFSTPIAELNKAAVNQFYMAPKTSRDAWNKLCRAAGNDGIAIPNKIHMTPVLSREYEIKKGFAYTPELAPYAGTISFLQKPGGKLRSVVNANRFVNSVLDPYAKALTDAFYHQPAVAVLNQKQGLEWAKAKLRDGVELTSLDLTAATDLLDYRVFVDQLVHQDKYPMLRDSAKFFVNIASECPYYVPDLDTAVSFRTGQPLGVKGSFQTLSAMNFLAGREAAKRAGLDPDDSYRVVGDDIVLDSRMTDQYSEIIRSWGGEVNDEKALRSSKYAEFLSHLVTKTSITPIKPYYRPGRESLLSNAEKSTLGRIEHYYRLSERDKNSLSILAEISDYSLENLPDITGPQRLPFVARLRLSNSLRIVAEYRSSGPADTVEVSPESIDLSIESHDPYENESREGDRRIYTISDGRKIYQKPAQGPIHLEKGEFSTAVDRFDHHTHTRVDTKVKHETFHEQTDELVHLVQQLAAAMNDESSSDIDIGHGMSVPADEVAIRALMLEDGDTSDPIVRDVKEQLDARGVQSAQPDSSDKAFEQGLADLDSSSHDLQL